MAHDPLRHAADEQVWDARPTLRRHDDEVDVAAGLEDGVDRVADDDVAPERHPAPAHAGRHQILEPLQLRPDLLCLAQPGHDLRRRVEGLDDVQHLEPGALRGREIDGDLERRVGGLREVMGDENAAEWRSHGVQS
jgi:hypothetical protein